MHAGVMWESKKRPIGRPGSRWEDNIKTGLGRNRMRCMDWDHLAQDRDHPRAFMNLRVP
jgi:hypothetical protein